MPTSTSYNHTKTRDQIIARSLRILGAIGQGEVPQATAVTEASETLNDMVKEWESDGMQLWCVKEYNFTPVAGTATYNIGIGATVNQLAPTKVLQAWSRVTANSLDTPIILITRHEYNMLGSKTTQGSPSQFWYNPPGEISGTENLGVITLYVTPGTNYASASKVYFTGVRPIADFDASGDLIDFPQYWYNAVVWGLAEQLSYEYGIGLSERAMVGKKAAEARERALSFGTEEGHLLIQPAPHWQQESW
jgi:hypothetical protein